MCLAGQTGRHVVEVKVVFSREVGRGVGVVDLRCKGARWRS